MNWKTLDHNGVLKVIFDNATDGMLLANVGGTKFHMTNSAFCKMSGYSAEECKKIGIKDLHPEQDIDFVPNQFSRQALNKQSIAQNIPLRKKDGSIFYVDINFIPVTLNSVKCMICILRDITERRQIETILKESEENFRLLMEATNDALWDWDISTNKVYRNPRHATMLGYEPHELTTSQEEWTNRIHPDDKQLLMEYFDKCINSNLRENFEIEYRLKTKSGDYKWILGRGKVVSWNNDGKPQRMIGTNIDIQKRKQAEQEILFKTAILEAQSETTIDGILIVDDQGKAVLFNEHFGQMWKIPPEILETKDDKKMLSHAVKLQKYPEAFIEKVEYLYANKSEKSRDEVELKDGRFFDRYSSPLLGPNGQYFGRIWYFRDITESKNLAKAIRESEERYRTLVESAGESIMQVDKNGTFLFVNKTAAMRLGYEPEEIIGNNFWTIFTKEIADRFFMDIQKSIQNGRGMGQIELVKVHDQERWYNTSIEPIKDINGKVTSILIIARDIHELKLAQIELDQYREDMARAEQLASIGTLSATAAHELTQPLTIIRLLIENALTDLQTSSSTEAIITKLKDSLNEISNITSVVDRLRNFARQSTESLPKEVNLKNIIQKTVNLLKESSDHPQFIFELKGIDKLPLIHINERNMEQMFFSLIANAMYAGKNRNNSRLVIKGSVRDNNIELEFIDNCGGIKPEHLKKIFVPFFTTKPINEGTGLGLCIVENIVSRAGGKIRVDSKYGEGTTFFITLPISNLTK